MDEMPAFLQGILTSQDLKCILAIHLQPLQWMFFVPKMGLFHPLSLLAPIERLWEGCGKGRR